MPNQTRRLTAPSILVFSAALAVTLFACGGSPSDPQGASVQGQWVGLTRGVRVELNLGESTQPDPNFGSYPAVAGNGSLTIIETGASLPFTAHGFHQSGPTGILINLEVPGQVGQWYGHFWGQLNSSGALAGAIDGSVPNTIGPFQGGSFADKPITLLRK